MTALSRCAALVCAAAVSAALVCAAAVGAALVCSACQPTATLGPASHQRDRADIAGHRLIPEQAPVGSVMVSLKLLTERHQERLVEAIVDAGATVVVIVPRELPGGLENRAFADLRDRLGPDLGRVGLFHADADHAPSVWARDWGPLVAADVKTDGPVLLDFTSLEVAEGDDDVVAQLARGLDLPRVDTGIEQKHGDFMVDAEGRCYVSVRIEALNSPGQPQQGASYYDELYAPLLGCASVIPLPLFWPDLRNGHIDQYVKVVGDRLFVSELQAPERSSLVAEDFESLASGIDAVFDSALATLADHGLAHEVVRIPMARPPRRPDGGWRTYTNALLVNGTALVPSYLASGVERATDPADSLARLLQIEQDVAEAYRDAGYEPVFVEASDLVTSGGAIHCVTIQSTYDLLAEL